MSNLHPKPTLARQAALAGAVGVLAGTALWLAPWSQAKERAAAPPAHLKLDQEPITRDGPQIVSFAPVVKRVVPSVVQVAVTSQPRPTAWSGPDVPFFRRFFGEGPGFGGPSQPFQTPPRRGEGSGVIVSENGYILTNNHVVESADTIEVTLNDGREFTGRVIGRDPQTDIAVLKIDASDLPAVTVADSDLIEVGDLVLAVGNPFGIGQTVTTGIVSAKSRATLGLDYEDFIQTDAAINPGNSGGALVDIEGRLIGINTAILSRTGGNQGIGFAVPTNLARWVMDDLIDDGRIERGFLGVSIQDVTPELARQFDLEKSEGALVAEVTPRSPAAKAGLQSGDVILTFDGKPIADSRRLKLAVGATAPGATVPIEIVRDGELETLRVTLKGAEGTTLARNESAGDPADEALRGVGVTDLDASNSTALRVPSGMRGAVVTQVEPDSAAYTAGLRPGDVIVEINRRPIANAEEAVAACENPEELVTLVKIWREGRSRFLVVDETRNS